MPDFIPPTFIALALAHFLALLSPGPDFFLIAGHAVRYRLRGTLFICTGIALGNAVYIVIAIAGWSAIKHSPLIYKSLETAGAIYLLWMGSMLIRTSRHEATFLIENRPSVSRTRQLCLGLASALLNPKNAVFYLTLMTLIIGADATLAQQIFSGIWMALLVFAWDTAIAATISHPKAQQMLQKRIPLIERLTGVFLIGLAISFVMVPLISV